MDKSFPNMYNGGGSADGSAGILEERRRKQQWDCEPFPSPSPEGILSIRF